MMWRKIIIGLVVLFSFVAPLFLRADTLDDIVDFNIDSKFDQQERSLVSATLKVISEKAYFYIENNWWDALGKAIRIQRISQLINLADEFDKNIYPPIVALFGKEWDPGIDQDSRITVLFSELSNSTGGYFSSGNNYSKKQLSESNAREMFYLNSKFIDSPTLKYFLAHEFQHLSSFNQKERIKNKTEDIWLNELRSEYSPEVANLYSTFVGSLLEQRINKFLQEPSNSLTEWNNTGFDYGQVALFAQYLGERFGHTIYKKMMESENVGIKSIDDALQSMAIKASFADTFRDWTVANWINNATVEDGRYGYKRKELAEKIKLSPTDIFTIGENSEINFSASLKDWTGYWYKILPSDLFSESSLNIDLKFFDQEGSRFLTVITKNKENITTISNVPVVSGNARTKVVNFGKEIRSVVIIPTIGVKQAGFGASESERRIIIKINAAVKNPAPMLTSVSSQNLQVVGGERLSILGENFIETTRIFFNDKQVSDRLITFVSGNRIDVVTPSGVIGPVSVKIVNLEGEESELQNAFNYFSPFKDGDLIRAVGGLKIYIVQGIYARWIMDRNIFDIYGHFSFDKVIDVDPIILESFKRSVLIREVNDPRVYEVNDDGVKHWIDMTAEEFIVSGRRWEMIYIVNKAERDYYQTGDNVLFR